MPIFRTRLSVRRCGVRPAVLGVLLLAAGLMASTAAAETVVRLPIRTDGPKSLDPHRGTTTYDNMCSVQMYETLLEVSYTDVNTFRPLLLAAMPERLDDGKRFRFRLKKGVYFHDDPCFEGGRGREMTTKDVFYSFKRLADKKNELKNWWLFKDTIVGFDAYKDAQNAAPTFDYDAPVEGFVEIGPHEFEIVLREPVTRFLWVLTMFQTSIVPREAVERYGDDFASRPVGTGPYRFVEWVPKKSLVVERHPRYHETFYPAEAEWSAEDRERGLHEAAGTRLPIPDRLVFTMYVQDQPMWLDFRSGRLAYTEVPAEYYEEAFSRRTRRLKREFRKEGVQAFSRPLLDFIFRGFNLDDELVGGYSDERIALRTAICLAIDFDEFNSTFYNDKVIVFDGPIPPGLAGHPPDGRGPVSNRGPDIKRAKALLAKAGYPDGKGLPPIKYFVNRGGNSPQQADLMQRQLERIGVRLDVQFVDFSTLIQTLQNKKAPMFSYAWLSDYPDAENNLALFYSPNAAPGSNRFNYRRPAFDRLYEQVLVMTPGPERTKILEQMRDMVIADAAFAGAMARTRDYLVAPWVKNAKPNERFWSWFKYLDVDAGKLGAAQ